MTTKTILKIVALCVICAAIVMAGCITSDDAEIETVSANDAKADIESVLSESNSPTPFPTPSSDSSSGMDFDGIREFENVEMRFISYTFDTHGKIEQIGDTYRVECGGFNIDGEGRVYAIIVNEVIDGKDYCFIMINHGYGSIEYDYEINDRKLKEMINKSTQLHDKSIGG